MENVYATMFLPLIDGTLPSLLYINDEIIHYIRYIISRISIFKQVLFYFCIFILICPNLIGIDSYWAQIANYILVSSFIRNNAMSIKPSASSFRINSASKFYALHCNNMFLMHAKCYMIRLFTCYKDVSLNFIKNGYTANTSNFKHIGSLILRLYCFKQLLYDTY